MPLIDFAWFCQPASQGMVPRQEPQVSDWQLQGLPGKHLRMATGRTDHPITKGDAQRSTKNPRIKPCKGPIEQPFLWLRTATLAVPPTHGSQKRLREARRVALAFSSAELAVRRLSPEPLPEESLPQSQKMSLPVCQQNCHIVAHFRPNRLQRGAAYTDNPLQLHVSTVTCIDVLALDEVTDSAISSSSTACFSARALHQSWASRLAFTKTD